MALTRVHVTLSSVQGLLRCGDGCLVGLDVYVDVRGGSLGLSELLIGVEAEAVAVPEADELALSEEGGEVGLESLVAGDGLGLGSV
jgi:hypothetical protein